MTVRAKSGPGAERVGPGGGVPGTVYLLCFGPEGLHVTGNRYARHYLGWTEGAVDARIDVHVSGAGSPLVRAAMAAGCPVDLVRTWGEVDRHFERALKRRREAPRLCPACVAAGRTEVDGGRRRDLIITERDSLVHVDGEPVEAAAWREGRR